MFRNVSCFVSLDAAFYYSTFYDLLKCLIKTFAAVSIPQGIGNLLSLLECLKENIIKKGWAWFKLTTREFRWDQIWIKSLCELKGARSGLKDRTLLQASSEFSPYFNYEDTDPKRKYIFIMHVHMYVVSFIQGAPRHSL